MALTVLHHDSSIVPLVGSDMQLELGAILLWDAATEPTLRDLAELLRVWRANPWCAVALLRPSAVQRSFFRSLLPDSMATVVVGSQDNVIPGIRTAVARVIPSQNDLLGFLSVRLGHTKTGSIETHDAC
jgi:hypothetical protein